LIIIVLIDIKREYSPIILIKLRFQVVNIDFNSEQAK